jgi:adenylate cyclase
MTALILTAAGLGLVLLAGWLWRERQHSRRLELLVKDRSTRLERLQSEFERFAPSEVIEHLSDPGGGMAPARRSVTVMFADLRGFTSLSENADPADTVGMLNGYFQRMTEAIDSHHGHVTQFIGDGLLALFGALEPNPWQARDAVLAALAMRDALADYNAQLRKRGLPELRFGVGIHHGDVVAGVMGNQSLSTFSVVGDTVNTAARVEQLTRVHEVDLLITDAVRQRLDARFDLRELPAVPVKGKQHPVVTWAVLGTRPAGTPLADPGSAAR